MAWLICLVCGIAGVCLAWFLGDWLTGVYRMSNMEGGRGFFVVFALGPLGLLGGVVVSALTVWRLGGVSAMGYFKLQGIALAVVLAVALGAAGVAYVLADHPPRLDGQPLVLDFELRLPDTSKPPDQQQYPSELRAWLSEAGASEGSRLDNAHAQHQADGSFVVAGRVALLSHSTGRSLMGDFLLADGQSQGFTFVLPLAGAPAAADKEWSPWIAEQGHDPAVPKSVQLRYRVAPLLPRTDQ
ncbi:MAG: hypothetical protein P4L83_20705 [Nevskia sp.]|nr:hypothetical protein [Nevskia sp.]